MSVKNRYCSVPWILVLLSSFLILNYNAQAEELSVCSTPESSKCIDDPEKIYAYLYPRCSECIGEERCSCEDNNEVNTNECKLRPFEYCKNCEGGTVENDCFGGLNTCFEDKKCILKSGGNGAQVCSLEENEECYCNSNSSGSLDEDCNGDVDKCYQVGKRCILEEGVCQVKRDFDYCCEKEEYVTYSCSGLMGACEGDNQCKYSATSDSGCKLVTQDSSTVCSSETPSGAPSGEPSRAPSTSSGSVSEMFIVSLLIIITTALLNL
jgi:hypothetical protein